jgi:hypothetical protein
MADREPYNLQKRLVDLIKTELALNPLHVVLSAQSLRVELNDWWRFLGNEDGDFEKHLCQEMQSFTERRELLQSESNALKLMIQTLEEVFPSKLFEIFSTKASHSRCQIQSRSLKNSLRRSLASVQGFRGRNLAAVLQEEEGNAPGSKWRNIGTTL